MLVIVYAQHYALVLLYRLKLDDSDLFGINVPINLSVIRLAKSGCKGTKKK